MPDVKLSKAQAGKLGGLANVENNGREGLARAGAKGGRTTRDKQGESYFVRLAHRRWGRDVKVGAE